MAKALYNKQRPKSFKTMVGNEDTIERLAKAAKKRTQCYLLYGPTGCGKTTLSYILVKELGCHKEEFREVDSATFNGIDTVRDVRRKVNTYPLEGECKVWLFDECHKMTNEAQNALLKVLEMPPKHVYFIFCTTAPEKLLATVKGRLARFPVGLLTDTEMKRVLTRVVKREKKTLKESLYNLIIQNSMGQPRDAIQLLEQTLAVPSDRRRNVAEKAAIELSKLNELCQAMLKGASWKQVSRVLRGLKDQQPESLRLGVLGYCGVILLRGSDNPRAGLIMELFNDPFYNTGFNGLIYACYAVTKS